VKAYIGKSYRLASISKGRVAGSNKQIRVARQLSYNILCNPIRKIDVLGGIAHIIEGKNGDRRLLWER